jgi:putative tricarboxylic transport membrane protein
MRQLAWFMGSFALLGVSVAVAQDDFPNKPIEVVIHSSYGGGTDTTARMMMIRSRSELDTDMYVVSKRGGSGAAAQNYVLSKPADGYTLMALTQSHLYTMARGQSDMKIDDIVGVARAMDDPTFITVRAESPHQSLQDLIDASADGPLNWGVAQIGGTEHIGLAQLAVAADFEYKPVAFGSDMQMVQALASGSVDAALPNVSQARSLVEDGSLRPVAVMAKERLADFPDVPTTFEAGYEVATSTTRGYAVLASTPRPIVEKLSEALVAAMSHDTFANYLASAGLTVEGSVAGTDVWDQHLKEEYAKAEQAINELGIAPE